jgi:hypothetical protein
MMTYELDDVEKQALMDKVVERARAELNDGRPLTEMRQAHKHEFRQIEGQSAPQCECGAVRDYDNATRDRILAGVQDVGQVTSIATLRAAIMDVVDAGCHHDDGMSHEWKFNAAEESFANEQRCAFVDRVAERVVQLQAVPHLYDESLLAKLRDRKAEYQRGYSSGWEDAMADREEMRESVEKGIR